MRTAVGAGLRPARFVNASMLNRNSIRKRGYDYSRFGAYFVTICAYERRSIFGSVTNEKMCLNEVGCIVENAWYDLPKHYSTKALNTIRLYIRTNPLMLGWDPENWNRETSTEKVLQENLLKAGFAVGELDLVCNYFEYRRQK